MTAAPTESEPWVRSMYAVEVIELPRGPQERKWTVSIEKYHIRRSWALALVCPDTPGLHEVVAYFRSEEQAEKFAKLLRVMVNDR